MMKKLLSLSLIASFLSAVIFVCPSCGERSDDILWYQSYPLSATVEIDGAELSVSVDGTGGARVKIISDGETGGTEFVFGDGERIVCGDLEIPLAPDTASRLRRLADAFMLGSSDVTSIEADGDSSAATFSHGGITYVITYDGDGIPLSIEYTSGGKSVVAQIIKLAPSSDAGR